MATDLPGIRARAEWDLNAFRQQEAELKKSLQSVAEQMRAIPSARITVDTTQARQQTQAAVDNIRNTQTAITNVNRAGGQQRVADDTKVAQQQQRIARQIARDVEDGINRQIRAERLLAQERIQAMRQATSAQEAFARRQKARRDEDIREQEGAARAARGDERRGARAEVPIGLAVGGIGIGVTKELVDATKAAADFEKAMSQVRAVLSPAELAASGSALRELALTLGNSGLGATAVQAAGALEAMSKAGISAQDQMSGLPSVLALAAAGNVSVSDSAELAAIAIQTFGLAGTELQKVSNILIGVANATTTDIDKIRLSLAQTGAVANLQNQTFEQTAIAIGLMAQAGIRSSDAGTGMRTMLLRLQPETARQMELMQRYGLIVGGVNKFVDQATGEFKQFSDIAAILNEAFKDATSAQQQFALRVIFGQDAVRVATVLAKAGAEGFAQLTGEVNEQGDALRVAGERLNNLSGDLQNLNAVWKNVQIAFATGIEADLRGPVQQLTALLKVMQTLTPETVKTAAVIAAAIGAVFTIGGVAVTAAAGIKLLGITFAVAAASAAGIVVPIALVAAGVALLGAAWINNWGDIQGKTQEVAKVIGGLIKTITGDFKALQDILSTPLKFGVEAKENDPALDFFKAVVDKARDFGTFAGEAWVEKFKEVLLRSIPGFGPIIAGLIDVNNLLKPRREAQDQAEKVRQQTEAQAAIEPQIPAERQRIAETILEQAPEIKAALVQAYAEGFAAVQNSAPVKGGGGVAGREFADGFRAQVEAAFPGVGEDITNTIITAIALAGQDQIPTVAAASAEAFKNPWERALQSLKATNDNFALALANLGKDTEAINVLLALEQAAKQAEQGYKGLTDRGLVAFLVAKQNEIGLMEQGEERYRAQIALGAEYTAHLEAQKKTQEDAAKAQKLAEDIKRTASDLFEERARGLISTTYPALTAAERELVEIKLKEGQAFQASQIAIAAAGGDVSQLGAIYAGTGAQAAQFADDLKRIVETSDVAGNALRITKDRSREFLDTLIQDLPAATRAQLEFTAATTGPGAAIAQAYEAIGLPLAQIPDFANASAKEVKELTERFKAWKDVSDPVAHAMDITKDRTKQFLDAVIKDMPAAARAQIDMVNVVEGPLAALRAAYQALGFDMSKIPDFANASSTALKQAAQQVEAAKFFQETGKLLPASPVEDAGKKWREAASKAAADMSKAIQDVETKLEEAKDKWGQAVVKAANELAKAEQTYSNTIAKINSDLAKALDDIDAATGDALDKFEKSIREIDRKQDKLFADARRKSEERARKLLEDRTKVFFDLGKTLKDINEQISEAVSEATKDQQKQLAELASSLAKLRAQEADQARNASTQIEDLALKEMQAQTSEERNQVAKERIRIQAEQGAQAVALQKEITKGQADLHKDAAEAQKKLLKQIADLQKQAKEAIEKATEQLTKLREESEKAELEAKRELAEQLGEIKLSRFEAAEARDKSLRELQKRRQEAQQQAAEARRKAEEQLEEAKRQHREALEKAEQERREAEEQADRELEDAQQKHSEVMRKADEDLRLAQDQVRHLIDIKRVNNEQLEVLEDIKAIRTPHVINMNNTNIEEGDVEFIQRATEESERLAREPIG